MGDFTGEKTKRWIEGLEKRGWREELVPRGYEASQRLGLKPSVHCEWTGATWEKNRGLNRNADTWRSDDVHSACATASRWGTRRLLPCSTFHFLQSPKQVGFHWIFPAWHTAVFHGGPSLEQTVGTTGKPLHASLFHFSLLNSTIVL